MCTSTTYFNLLTTGGNYFGASAQAVCYHETDMQIVSPASGKTWILVYTAYDLIGYIYIYIMRHIKPAEEIEENDRINSQLVRRKICIPQRIYYPVKQGAYIIQLSL